MSSALSFRKVSTILAILIGITFYSSIDGAFHFDDTHSIESNVAIRSMANIPSFWSDPRTSSFIPENRVYRPMVYTLYSVCWWIGQGSTHPFHVMKLLMHLSVCLALFLIWRRLWSEPGWFPEKIPELHIPFVSRTFRLTPDWAALFLAMLFSVHPATSECVDYIAATTSLQCAMFYLWAYVAYLKLRESAQLKFLAISMGLYFLSVASKEEGITLPAMIVLTELFLSRGTVVARLKKAATSVLPYAAMAVVLAAWIYAMHPTEGNESRGFVSPFEYFITQWRAYLWYMRLWFWPFDLNADNASIVYSKSLSDSLVIQAAIGNLALLAFAWASRRKWPALLFGVLWFYVTISPASSVIVLAEAINEHRMYLAYIGFVGGTFTVLLALAPSLKPRVLGVLFVAIMAGFFYGSRERNRVWLSDENLWADTVEKNPTSGRALNNLALVYMSQGRYPEAIQMLERCEQAWSTYMYCPLNIGVADTALGFNARGNGKKDEADRLFAQAEKAYRRALDLNPKNVHANFHLARYYQDVRQDWNKALEMFTTAVDVTGGRYPAADVQRALCLEKLGRRAEADRALDRALSVEPTSGAALFEKARIAFEGGQIPQSIATYRQLLQVEPGNNLAWYNLSVALIQKGDIPAARETLERFLKLDPSSEQGLFNMIYVSDRLGDGSGAVRAATELARLRPAKGEYRGRLEELRKKYGASAS